MMDESRKILSISLFFACLALLIAVLIGGNDKMTQEAMIFEDVRSSAVDYCLSDSLVEAYRKQFQKEEEELYEALETSTGITYYQIKYEKMQLDKIADRQIKKLAPQSRKGIGLELISLTCNVLKDMGIDPDKVVMLPDSCTAMCGGRLLLCEKQLKEISEQAAQGFIAHEMIHYIYEDDIYGQAILNLLKKKKIRHEQFDRNHPYNRLAQLHERRADLLAAMESHTFACGLKDGFKALYEKHGDFGDKFHPPVSSRIKELEALIACYQVKESPDFSNKS